MRSLYLVAYDVCDAKRLRKTHKLMKGYGDALQFSIFHCELTPLQLQSLRARLWPVLNLEQDRVMVVRLGPVEGGEERIEYWGRPLEEPPRGSARVV